jgi:hypothetical protein
MMQTQAPLLMMEIIEAAHSGTGQREIYLVLDGKRIAHRGHPGSAEAGTWIPLVPDLTFYAGSLDLKDFAEPEGEA